MATVTLTPAESWFQPPTTHHGTITLYGERTVSATGAAGALLCKLPYGARVVNGAIYYAGGAFPQIKVGVSANAGLFVQSNSGSVVVSFMTRSANSALTWKAGISGTDTDVPRYETLRLTGSASFGGVVSFWVQYFMDTDDQHGTGSGL